MSFNKFGLTDSDVEHIEKLIAPIPNSNFGFSTNKQNVSAEPKVIKAEYTTKINGEPVTEEDIITLKNAKKKAYFEKKETKYRYSEDKILQDLKNYIDATYEGHYNEDDNISCIDTWIAMGDSGPTFRNTAIKYLWRYGKKEGFNKKDLMKSLHYIFFLLHLDHYKDKK